ncbi:MAG: AarF/UbiB family protein [Myxococcota bacterium]
MSQLSRLSQIATILAKHGFASQWESKNNQMPAPIRFRNLLQELGTTYIKIGQLLSTRSDLLPPDFIEALSTLQSQASVFPFEQARAQIEQSLKKPIHELFASISEEPLASASVAQVHEAVLLTGERVVIKILRPGIREQVREDAALFINIIQVLGWFVQEVTEFGAKELAYQFTRSLTAELDFINEAKHLKAFALNNAGREGVKIPKLYEALSSSEIMTLEHIDGRPISALVGEPELAEQMVELLLELEFHQVFSDGLFHADPHPGNILITPDNQIAFIDFGMMGKLARDHQERLLMILIALALKDPDTLARQLIYLGNPDKRVNLQRFREAIRSLLDRYVGRAISSIEAGSLMADMLHAAMEFQIRLPKEFALLTKMSMTLEGIVRLLHPGLNVASRLAKHAEALFIERLDPRNLKGSGLKTALQLAMLSQDLPQQIYQTFSDLQRGELRMEVASPDWAKLDRTLKVLAVSVTGGLANMAVILGGFYIFDRNPTYAVILWALCALSTASSFVWIFLGGKLPKFSFKLLSRKS